MNRRRVWLHRSAAILWLAFGILSFYMGWQAIIALVWFASVYANVASHWAGAEAADDKTLIERLDRIEKLIKDLRID